MRFFVGWIANGLTMLLLTQAASGSCILPSIQSIFAKLRNDNLPIGAKRVLRPVDATDLQLIHQSYYLGSREGPIEMGIVELLDRSGKVIDSQMVKGVHRVVYHLNQVATALLHQHGNNLAEIATIQIRHSHPTEFATSRIVGDVRRFSAPDKSQDKLLRKFMDSDRDYQKIRLRSWITFITDEPSSTKPSQFLMSDLRTRGYEL